MSVQPITIFDFKEELLPKTPPQIDTRTQKTLEFSVVTFRDRSAQNNTSAPVQVDLNKKPQESLDSIKTGVKEHNRQLAGRLTNYTYKMNEIIEEHDREDQWRKCRPYFLAACGGGVIFGVCLMATKDKDLAVFGGALVIICGGVLLFSNPNKKRDLMISNLNKEIYKSNDQSHFKSLPLTYMLTEGDVTRLHQRIAAIESLYKDHCSNRTIHEDNFLNTWDAKLATLSVD
ncbi:MAG: hypothetical protein H0W88_07125 [Parachlamydiaceae bacterium]|nr:hypothetical protein [Parachlamydiaceae bacterium]